MEKTLKALLKFATLIDKLNEKVGIFSGWLTTALVVIVCYDVFTRYVLSSSSVAVQELEWHLFAVIFLFGAAYTFKYDRHVRVDVFYQNFSPKHKAWVNLLGCLIFLIPFTILVIKTSHVFVWNSFTISETSPDAGGLPARYILKACIPLGFFFLLLQGFSKTIHSLSEILGTPESEVSA